MLPTCAAVVQSPRRDARRRRAIADTNPVRPVTIRDRAASPTRPRRRRRRRWTNGRWRLLGSWLSGCVAAPSKKLLAFANANCALHLHGVLRDAEPDRDFLLRQAIDLPQSENLSTAIGQ